MPTLLLGKKCDANARGYATATFAAAHSVLEKGKERQLNDDDLWQLEGDDGSAAACAELGRRYLAHDRSLLKAVVSTHGLSILVSGFVFLLADACVMFAPIVLHHVVEKCTQPALDTVNLSLWIAVFAVSRLVHAFADAYASVRINMDMMRLSASLKFEKALRRSAQSKRDTNAMAIFNLFTIVVIVHLLYRVLGVAAFAVLAVLLATTAITYVISKGMSAAFGATMGAKDVRMHAAKELFTAI
ncbi:TPA: hypothetical protein N0F65_004750 [Lagenidium giganteum]|uniref:ABC transmembrane type-1 domain-containing protein n=1 Tax=Lagenidium giganteum TaxID=4803 RepID=A0AAV2YTV6_9STRA|nr:TPA: hypothetical protein N0F65_004750 [Lagenidium giganteum]